MLFYVSLENCVVPFFFFFRTMAKERAVLLSLSFISIQTFRLHPDDQTSAKSFKLLCKKTLLEDPKIWPRWTCGHLDRFCFVDLLRDLLQISLIHPSISFPRPSFSLRPPKRCRSKLPPSALPSVLHTLSQQS